MLCTPFALFGWNKCHNHNPVDCSFSQMRCQEKRLFQIQTVFACLFWQQTLLLEQETEAFQKKRSRNVRPLCFPCVRQTADWAASRAGGKRESRGQETGRARRKAPDTTKGAPLRNRSFDRERPERMSCSCAEHTHARQGTFLACPGLCPDVV